MEEEWRVSPIYRHYEFSNKGRVRYIPKNHIKKLTVSARGYATFALNYNGKMRKIMVHQEVATCFLGPRPKGCVIDHIDNNRLNNRVENLRYVSPSENIKNSKKKYRTPLVLCVEGLDEFLLEFDMIEELKGKFSYTRLNAVVPTLKDGVWLCKTYE